MLHALRSTNDHDAVIYTKVVTIRFDPLDVSKLKYLQSQKNGSPTFLYSAGLTSVDPGVSLLIPIVSIGRDRRLLLRLVVGVLDVYCSSHRIVINPFATTLVWHWRVSVGRQRYRPCACGLSMLGRICDQVDHRGGSRPGAPYR